MAAVCVSFQEQMLGKECDRNEGYELAYSRDSKFGNEYRQMILRSFSEQLQSEEKTILNRAMSADDELEVKDNLREVDPGSDFPDNANQNSECIPTENKDETKKIMGACERLAETIDSHSANNEQGKCCKTEHTLFQKCQILKEIYEKYNHKELSSKNTKCTSTDLEKLPKKKKWKRVNNEDFGFKETLFPRPVRDNTEIDIDSEKLFNQIEGECDRLEEMTSPFQSHMEMEGNSLTHDKKYIRPDRDRKIEKAHKQVKSKYCSSVRNNAGRKKLFIHHRLYKIMTMEIQRLCYLPSKRKERNLLQREELKSAQKVSPYRKEPNRAPVQSLAHALHKDNAPTTFEHDVINVLISLQHRELTPEDYELLLRLDESVAPKTISKDKIDSFKTDVVTDDNAGELCAICMDPYEVGQTRKFLPCNHVFHDNCITMWLNNSSLNCPIDNLPVDDA
ncbi:hypothetical protein FSP39_020229 [Pinctada imbricata]|uniref:RING-type domain-containing protein n=1 Tax=Pinctada imbricata TaxID=66713 RepID=A0AA88XNE8_PINIB|nr:hypothetical protein FSP39_020229 [Pinctada imbricata]